MWWVAAAKTAQNAIGTLGTYYNTRTQNAALKYQAKMNRINAGLERQKAELSLANGEKQEQQIQNAAAKLKGKQKVGYGASGVRLDSKSAQQVLNETDYMAQVDELRTHANALADAWSHRLNAVNYENNANIALSKQMNPVQSAVAYSVGQFLADIGSYSDLFGGGDDSKGLTWSQKDGFSGTASSNDKASFQITNRYTEPAAPSFTISNRYPYVGGQGFSLNPYSYQSYGFNWWR